MRVLHISNYDNNFNYPRIIDTPINLVQTIEKEYPATELFIIDYSYSCDDPTMPKNAGIELLKLLRLKGFQQHCIVYSAAKTRETLLLENPKDLILFSPGVTFMRLPLIGLDLEKLVQEKAPSDLTTYFKTESYESDRSHFYANWWGAYKLLEIQQIIDKVQYADVETDLQNTLGEAYNELNSFSGLLARYLNKIEYKDLERILHEKEQLKREHFDGEELSKVEIEEDIQRCYSIIESLQDEDFLQKLGLVKEKKKSFVMNFLEQKGLIKRQKTKEEIITEAKDTYVAEIRARESDLQVINDLDEEINFIQKFINDENRILKSLINLQSQKDILPLSRLREELKKKNPAILFVDDQADEGWANVFQRIIYGGDSNHFITYIPQKDDSTTKISTDIQNLISEHKIDLLILDVRLKDEKGQLPLSEISGIQVLEKLNSPHLQCPILVTSGSNKIWTYQEVLDNGASAYWIKQGLVNSDNRIEYTIQNYVSFVQNIWTLTLNPRLRFYYDDLLPTVIEFLDRDSVYWWETHGVLNGNRKDISQKISEALSYYKETSKKITQSHRKYFSPEINALIIIRFFEVIEFLFRNSKRGSLSERINEVEPHRYDFHKSIFYHRNNAIHELTANSTKTEDSLKGIIAFLKNNSEEYYETEDVAKENDNPSYNITLEKPEPNKYYYSIIEALHSTNENLIFIKNPNLDLEYKSILIYKKNFINLDEANLKSGVKVKFQLLFKKNNIYGTKAELIIE